MGGSFIENPEIIIEVILSCILEMTTYLRLFKYIRNLIIFSISFDKVLGFRVQTIKMLCFT